MTPLLPALLDPTDRPALRFGDHSLTYAELAVAAGALAAQLPASERIAVVATPSLSTVVGVTAALLAGVPAVPLNPRQGERELAHVLADAAPAAVLAAPGAELPEPLADLPRIDIGLDPPGPGGRLPPVAPAAEPIPSAIPAAAADAQPPDHINPYRMDSYGPVASDIGVPDIGGLDIGVPDIGGLDIGVPDIGGLDIGGPDIGGSDIGAPGSGTSGSGSAASGAAGPGATGSGPPAAAALRAERAEPPAGAPALVVYTSGTTGPPKGAVLSRRAVAANLDALADAWAWTADDVLAHALPLFHVHGLVLGVLGVLRRGGALHHLGTLTAPALAAAVETGATMVFGVPTQYHRLANELAADPHAAATVGRARLLVSGSAALTAVDHARILRATGLAVRERYGLTETLILTAARSDERPEPGTVGRPLPRTEVRLAPLSDDGGASDGLGAVEVRGPGLFDGYLNRPDATAAATTPDGWFATGDIARRTPSGAFVIVGRGATDMIKSGGYKIGAGEIENALLEHPAVAECAVIGVPDEDLGERVVAVVVAAGDAPEPRTLVDHVAGLLAPHKRPREVRFVDALPRNEMGKVVKARLLR